MSLDVNAYVGRWKYDGVAEIFARRSNRNATSKILIFFADFM